jgi:hypothetical protein
MLFSPGRAWPLRPWMTIFLMVLWGLGSVFHYHQLRSQQALHEKSESIQTSLSEKQLIRESLTQKGFLTTQGLRISTLVRAPFSHGNSVQLVLFMILFFLISGALEQRMHWIFLPIFGLVGSSLGFFVQAMVARQSHFGWMLGGSPWLMTMLGCFAYFFPKEKLYFFYGFDVKKVLPMPAAVLLVTSMCWISDFYFKSGTSWVALLSSFLFGVGIAAVYQKNYPLYLGSLSMRESDLLKQMKQSLRARPLCERILFLNSHHPLALQVGMNESLDQYHQAYEAREFLRRHFVVWSRQQFQRHPDRIVQVLQSLPFEEKFQFILADLSWKIWDYLLHEETQLSAWIYIKVVDGILSIHPDHKKRSEWIQRGLNKIRQDLEIDGIQARDDQRASVQTWLQFQKEFPGSVFHTQIQSYLDEFKKTENPPRTSAAS